jgi:pimeloyl-ACP methyl ester carboxylesterase
VWCALALASCVPDRECLLVRFEGVDLPLCVEGDRDSPHILLHLPGGPSAVGGWLYTRYGIRQELLSDTIVASMDYRGTGASKGHYPASRHSLEQVAADTNELVRVLHLRYPDKAVWLHGHSFGAAVAAAALIQEPLAIGWIAESGCVDTAANAIRSRDRLLQHTPSTDREIWADLQQEVEGLDPRSWDDYVTLNALANEADALQAFEAVDNANQGTLAWAVGMPFQLLQVGLPASSMNDRVGEDLFGAGLQLALPQITAPSLFLTGDRDFVCTLEHAEDTATRVSSATAVLEVFPNAGHELGDQYPVEAAEAVRRFLRDATPE